MTNYYNKDFYKVLGVAHNASEEDIKLAYRKLVRLYHPDVSKSEDNISKFKEIQQAYEVLTDENQRKKYDILNGYYRESIKKEFQKKSDQNKNVYDEFIKKSQKASKEKDIFSKSINEALDNLFHTKKDNTIKDREEKVVINGEDINLDINLSCFEAANGTNRKVNILHTGPCPNCGGRKFINGSECPMCKGTGQVSLQKKINVKIPKGVTNGSKIRVKKEGNKGLNGGKDGDLYLIVKIDKDPYWDTEGLNILCNMPVTPAEAVLGTEIHINLMENNLSVKIPPMTSSGQKLRLSGMGLSNKSKTKKGDLIITVQIKLPDSLSEEEKALYSKLYKISNKNIRKDINHVK